MSIKAPRCNYCKAPAIAWFSKRSYIASRGHKRLISVIVAACAEHEHSVNFVDQREAMELEG
jgi:hypothetical protein